MNLNYENTLISFNIIDFSNNSKINKNNKDLYRLSLILEEKTSKSKIEFVIVDVFLEINFKLKSSEKLDQLIMYEFDHLIDLYKNNKIVSKSEKRIIRIYFFINMIISRYINFYKIDKKDINKLKENDYIDKLKSIK